MNFILAILSIKPSIRSFFKIHLIENIISESAEQKIYKYKSSGYNQDNSVHIVQISPWQHCDYIIQSISDDGATTFVLTHAEMMFEMKLLKASRAHGTKVLRNNENIEFRMTLKIDFDDWQRWINNYRKDSDIFHS